MFPMRTAILCFNKMTVIYKKIVDMCGILITIPNEPSGGL